MRSGTLLKIAKGSKIKVTCNFKLQTIVFVDINEEALANNKRDYTTTKFLQNIKAEDFRFGIAFKGNDSKFKILNSEEFQPN